MFRILGAVLLTSSWCMISVVSFPAPEGQSMQNKLHLQNQAPNQNLNQQNLRTDQPMAGAASVSYDGYGNSNSYAGNYEYISGSNNYGFECYGKKPAFYGDGNYDCKVYHVCQADGRSDSFRCPKWTRFNNYLGICDWHFKVDTYCNPLEKYNSDSYISGATYGEQQGYNGGNHVGY